MGNRLDLHDVFIEILGTKGQKESRVYFQPPATVKMKYPAIKYGLEDIENSFANDGVYFSKRKYSVTVIDEDPDSQIVAKVSALPTSRFNRHYEAENLNHDVFSIMY